MRRATLETLAFALRWIGERSRIIEVGCGAGELAGQLQARGHIVTGIDSDPNAVEACRDRGVNAIHASWPHVALPLVDAILFTRSLHHMAPLDLAVMRARELAPLLLIEDFALHEVSPRFVKWLRHLVPDWEGHDVHPFSTIRGEVARHFRIVHEEDAPYAYRYLDEEQTNAVFAEELALGERPLGRRIVGVALPHA